MSESSPLVQDWIRYHSGEQKESDPLLAAWEEVNDLVWRDPEAGWNIILELIEAAPDARVLASVAAGPLEDLLKRSPEVFIDRVELQARRDPTFRRCLTGVWGLPASIRPRIEKYTSTVKDRL